MPTSKNKISDRKKSEIQKVEEEIEEVAKNIEEKSKKMGNEEKIMAGIIIILAIALIVMAFPYLKGLVNKEKTYSIEIIKIEGCKNCFDLDVISKAVVEAGNVKVKNEKTLNYDSSEAKEIIEEYGITRIPALVIVSKKIDEIGLDESIFRKDKNTAVFDRSVPYIDISSGEENGLVSLKEVRDLTCKECASLSSIQKQLENMDVKINSYEIVDASSDSGKKLINENNITYLPTLLLSKEIEEYWWVFPQISGSFIKNDEYNKFNQPLFPYKEVLTGLIKGKVRITYVTNNTCEECFNVTQLKSSFQGLGVYIDSEKYADVSSTEGKSLLNIYNITAIPTVILSKEISDYGSIKDVLANVGSFESDGTFVFRKLDVLKVKYQKI